MLINDLDKLMEEMGEKQQRNLHTEASIHHTEGIFLPPEEETNVSIEPCTGLIEEYNALIGDLYIPDEDDEDERPRRSTKTSSKSDSAWSSRSFLEVDDDMEFEFLDIK